MQNPFDPAPRRTRLDDEDGEHEQHDKKEGGIANPYEKALFDSRSLLISGPVDDNFDTEGAEFSTGSNT